MNDFFNLIYSIFPGVSPDRLVTIVLLVSMVARFFGPLIPDDKTGFMGFLRVVLNTVGLYSSNRIRSGISVSDVAKAVVDSKISVKDPDTGKFTSQTVGDTVKAQSHWVATLLAFAVVGMLMLSGCTTAQQARVQAIGQSICTNVPLAQALLDGAADSKRKATAQRVLDDLKIACPFILPQLNTNRVEAVANQPA